GGTLIDRVWQVVIVESCVPSSTAIARVANDTATYITLLIPRIHIQFSVGYLCSHCFVTSFKWDGFRNFESFSVVIRVIGMRKIITASWLWLSFRMVGRNVNPAFILARVKLHSMSCRVGVCSPILIEVVCCIDSGLFRSVGLGSYIHRFGPSFSPIGRGDVPNFAVAVSFTHLPFMVISGIVKQEDSSFGICRI